MENILYILALILFICGCAAVAAGTMQYWKGQRKMGAIVMAMGAAVIIAAVFCLMMELQSVEGSDEIRLAQTDEGGYVVEVKNHLFHQEALGPQTETAREEIAASFESGSGEPGCWRQTFPTWMAAEGFLGISLPWSTALNRAPAWPAEQEEGAELAKYELSLYGAEEGDILYAAVELRCMVEDPQLTAEAFPLTMSAYVCFSDEAAIETTLDPATAQQINGAYEMPNGSRAVVQTGGVDENGQVEIAAWFAREDVIYTLSVTGEAGQAEAMSSALTEVLSLFD